MKDTPHQRYLRNTEIDELCEGLIREHAGSSFSSHPVDIIGFATKYLKLRILTANINENEISKLGFLSDGKTALRLSRNSTTVSHVFPANTIVIDKVLCSEKEKSRRLFTIAHEVFHFLESRLNGTETEAAFHSEFNHEVHYTAVYGRNLFTAQDRTTLCNVADYLGVSLIALVIRMEHLNLFEKHAFCEYVSPMDFISTERDGASWKDILQRGFRRN